jgi:hypothetical protein
MSRIFLLVVLFGVARGCNKATQGPTFNFNLVEYPLYCGNSVKEFLSICKDVEWPKPDKGQDVSAHTCLINYDVYENLPIINVILWL